MKTASFLPQYTPIFKNAVSGHRHLVPKGLQRAAADTCGVPAPQLSSSCPVAPKISPGTTDQASFCLRAAVLRVTDNAIPDGSTVDGIRVPLPEMEYSPAGLL